ncbi:SgcJ/EcaC family oxidoreductase [Nocardiopsis sp. EMB25]|uniref:SgcJ/EcaC family oxidoreductase n=1 Tax=Nocardiopsis TaxID=2013 RepID=UPI00034B7AC8|nr:MULTISPECIES: SgcJ/EcaC family oxidoreductase [Nocardiopsis]MCY9783768.1 SgcJ/EcaC family oxidoreductase [Nocardiopsis sp. EMB25]
MTTPHTPDRTHETEIEAIRRVVAEVERAQRDERPDAFAALFRQDAIWTTAHGRRLFGREEISDFTHKVLPGAMGDLVPVYEVDHVQFIRPDVAAVKVRQRYLTRDGAPARDQPEGTPLYVMSKEDGRWLLTACQNTQVHG